MLMSVVLMVVDMTNQQQHHQWEWRLEKKYK
jgi:hypothetical protein